MSEALSQIAGPAAALLWLHVAGAVVGLAALPFAAWWFWREWRQARRRQAEFEARFRRRRDEIERGASSGLRRFRP